MNESKTAVPMTAEELEAMRATLRKAEAEVQRLLDEAEGRGHLIDILHEVMGTLSTGELFHMLARRLARALNLSHSSIIFARPGDTHGTVASAHENPQLENLPVDLDRYPEVAAALEQQQPVLIPDIWKSDEYKVLREQWQQDGAVISVRSVLALPFSLDKNRMGVFLLRRTSDKAEFNQADVSFAQTVIASAMSAMQRAHVVEMTRADNVRLDALAHTDALTHLLNRRALISKLMAEVERVRRYNAPLTVLMIDVDHFKLVNDTYGHLAGDCVLTQLAVLLQRAARSVDTVARYGGEEFVIGVPETGQAGAIAFADRLRAKIEGNSFDTGKGVKIHITVSIGVAEFPQAQVESAEELLDAADRALYRAKEAGRNMVCA